MLHQFFNKVSNIAGKAFTLAKQYAPKINDAINSTKSFITQHGGTIRNVLNKVRRGAAAFSVLPGAAGAVARGVAVGADFLHRGVSKAEAAIPHVTRWQENLGFNVGNYTSHRSPPQQRRPPPMPQQRRPTQFSRDVSVIQRPYMPRGIQIRA